MRLRRASLLCLLSVLCLAVTALPARAQANGEPREVVGTLPDGTGYRFVVPPAWNGTLLLTSDIPPLGGGPVLEGWMMDQGFALAGTGRDVTGYRLQQAFDGQIQALERFTAEFGEPRRTIAWGRSRGGLVTRGLIQEHPDRFDGAVPMCGGGAGTVAMFNSKLDASFAMRHLLAPNLTITGITDVDAANATVRQALETAQRTAEGRARIALVGAFDKTPVWNDPEVPEPAADDLAAQQRGIYGGLLYALGLHVRAEIEGLAGGNFSWNTGVDYAEQLERSGRRPMVAALYDQAGLDLDADLKVLAAAPRIEVDPEALAFAARNVTYTGRIEQPVLSLTTIGDAAGATMDSAAYRDVVEAAGRGELLRETFVHRAGHCTFSDAEMAAAFRTVLDRVETGKWPATTPEAMNQRAADLDAASPRDLGAGRYTDENPIVHLRAWDHRDTK